MPEVKGRARSAERWRGAQRAHHLPRRVRGCCGLPLPWRDAMRRDAVSGRGSLSLGARGRLTAGFGDAAGRAPRDAGFRRELDAELERMRVFLGVVD